MEKKKTNCLNVRITYSSWHALISWTCPKLWPKRSILIPAEENEMLCSEWRKNVNSHVILILATNFDNQNSKQWDKTNVTQIYVLEIKILKILYRVIYFIYVIVSLLPWSWRARRVADGYCVSITRQDYEKYDI